MPLLFEEDSIILVVSPLKVLGYQQENELKQAKIPAIALSAETATDAAFKVRCMTM